MSTAEDTHAAERWIKLLVEQAPRLRDAGVTFVRAGVGFEATIAPMTPEMPEVEGRTEVEFGADPLDDPATYGGHLPSFGRREQ